ncbi:MAG: aminoacyl-tRNA hydrolase [Gammaproteobacteria bacterium]|nr:aminoacyl-tRNA hydrolase [Gammaproteobacteria bacterium]MBT8105539.1 aminoacyl-tRNA hydrolase [Gammaproteobacteria bacterium]NNF50338.1 aminoacyl-tRNA hydrolase [Woeseiaceae bacterium]NNK25553.1 aminoacyl-tRNA hydrolase [Woeseiaceae bacterium]NNL64585.1 aminoacyl-tRNA hydrolase [Woeseiaceae bacterium]
MPKPIRIIAGLGNPEEKYERTLHNAGFWFVDALARKYGGSYRYEKKFDADFCRINLHGEDVWLVKPQSYMNLSGQPIRAVMDYYRLRPAELLVAHDEIDLPPGTVRLKAGGGHGGHNGLRDIIRHCGADFLRLRLGVGHPGEKHKVTNYVLKRGSGDVEAAVERNIDDAIDMMPDLVDGDVNAAMKKLHTKDQTVD